MAELIRHFPMNEGLAGVGYCLTPLPGFGIVKLQLPGAVPQAVITRVRPLPQIGQWTTIDQTMVAGIAPGEWLLLGEDAGTNALAGSLASTLGETLYLLTDLGHARFAFRLDGSAAEDILAALCPLDLSVRTFPPGRAARSLLGDAHLFLLRDAEGLLLVVDQTMAAYVMRQISAACP